MLIDHKLKRAWIFGQIAIANFYEVRSYKNYQKSVNIVYLHFPPCIMRLTMQG